MHFRNPTLLIAILSHREERTIGLNLYNNCVYILPVRVEGELKSTIYHPQWEFKILIWYQVRLIQLVFKKCIWKRSVELF